MLYQTQKATPLTAFDCWRIYSTIKMHFENESYNCFRFNFKARNLTPAVFSRRNDRYFFEKHASRFRKKDSYQRFVFSNIFFANRLWIGDFEDDCYREYLSHLQSMSYRFRTDLNILRGSQNPLDVLLSSCADNHPPIISRMIHKEIMEETVVIMDSLTSFVSCVKSSDTILWPSLKQDIQNAKPFIEADVDIQKMRKIALSIFTN